MSHLRSTVIVLLGICLLTASPLLGDDVYYAQPIQHLKITEGQLTAGNQTDEQEYRYSYIHSALYPYIVLDGPGQAYAFFDMLNAPPMGAEALDRLVVCVCAPEGKKVTGRLFAPSRDFTRLVRVRFEIPAEDADARNQERFVRARRQHYMDFLERDIPGAAWFRYQYRQASQQLNLAEQNSRQINQWEHEMQMEQTFALLSGGRALSENLQLDRIMPIADGAKDTVKIDSISGITVREFDWSSRLKGIDPKLDRLAQSVPDDQHVVFFPSFAAMIDLADYFDQQGGLVVGAFEAPSQSAGVRQQYEKQLCLPVTQLSRLLGPTLIDSVAMTGADPYMRTGADLAVIFHAKNAGALRTTLTLQVTMQAGQFAVSKPVNGDLGGVSYFGVRSPDRTICSYVAQLGNHVVVVTNSLAQLQRLIDVQAGKRSSLASLDEYRYFRHRYALGDDAESAFVMITDKTLRRWCGPKWRIAASRRTRALAVMSQMQAEKMDLLAGRKAESGPIELGQDLPRITALNLSPDGVISPEYGTLQFQTPIIEMDLQRVSKDEVNLYRRWRDGYQRNWSGFYDPIAIRIHRDGGKLMADTTVMPLIDNSSYRQLINVSQGVELKGDSGDRHADALAHLILSLNTKSPTVQQIVGFIALMGASSPGINPLNWLGESVELYIDDDPLWADIEKAEDKEYYLEHNWHRMPIAVSIASTNALKLTAFLTAIRVYIDQAAPGMTAWQPIEHNGENYVKIGPTEKARQDMDDMPDFAVYYAVTGKTLTLSLNENLIKRALDRTAARRQGKTDNTTAKASPWIGKNMAVRIDRKFMTVAQWVMGEQFQQQMQLRCWGNLPILNVWKRRYPDQDPVALHERLWKTRLLCPGGGQYRWNEQWQTMESTVYGHPGEPKMPDTMPPLIRSFTQGDFGLAFEPDGLRARVQLEFKPTQP